VAEVRPAGGADVGPVITAAFGDRGDSVAALWREIEDSGQVLGSLVAVDAGQVVGHVGLSPAWVDARRALVDVWVLSPLSVDPDEQGAGIGTALVRAAVEAARAGGASLLFWRVRPSTTAPAGSGAPASSGSSPRVDVLPTLRSRWSGSSGPRTGWPVD
jgi:putative acetyltransferase